jgi:Calx-beta domain
VVRSTMQKLGVVVAIALGATPLAVMGTAHALSNPPNPQLTLSRTISSHPWSGSGTNASDVEGLGEVPGDNSLWVADDNGDRIFEIDATTGVYKSQLDASAFQSARQVGTTTSAPATRTDDLESIVYDPTGDVLYVTSGNCCNSPVPGPPYFPTVFKLTRVGGHFSPLSWQALPEGQDPTAAGWRPGTGMYFGKGTKIKTYDFATNVVGPDITLAVSPIVGITFVSSSTVFVSTATANTASGRTTADSDSTIHRFDISGSTWTPNTAWTFPLRGTGVIDARDLAIVGDTFFVSDGYDSRANGDHPIYVYALGSAPSVSVGDAAVVEGATGTRSLRFSVTLSAATAHDVTVQYGTVAGTASPSSDYTAVSGTLTVPAGAASSSFNVPVRGDATVEDKESFGVRLSNPVGAGLGRAAGTGRILNDDVSSGLKVAIGDASVVEGTSGTRSLRLTVSLSAPAATTVAASYATTGGTATSGTDFVASTGTLTIPAGGTSTSFTVSVRGDTTVEPNETFTVQLSNASGAAIGRTTGVATVLNDD